jgi:Leucine-rich repeat (LRR) protein
MWISEGFVNGSSANLEEIGKEYYNELVMRNLIEPNARYNDEIVCSMHDVVRSFGQYMARDEALVAHSSDITGKLNSKRFIRLSLENEVSESDELDWSSLQTQKSLRTLISAGHIKIKRGNSLLSCSRLRTLHIDDADFGELPKSLDQLKHLRYLSVRDSNISRLPENIVNMKFLQCINISHCKRLVKLPDGIGKLRQLRFLGLNGTSINSMPKGFSGLTSLRKLYGFRAHMDHEWCSLEELEPLSQLIDLEINGLENVSSSTYAEKSKLGEKDHLSYLCLKGTNGHGDDGQSVKKVISEKEQQHIEEVFDKLCPPSRLENLTVEGYFGQRLPRWMTSTEVVPLGSLRILKMVDLFCCTELPIGSCQLPSLELLYIVRATAISRVGLEFLRPNHHCNNHSEVEDPFPRLRRLYFKGMIRWEEWEWEEQVKAMSFLEELTVERCKLRCMPPGLAFHTRVLKKLYISDVKHLSTLENFTSVVHLDVRNTDLQRISNLPNLQNLVIIECPNMKVLEGMPALLRLNLEDHDMETIPGYVQNIRPMSLVLDCSLLLLTSIAARNSGLEWDKLTHIQQVKAYAKDEGVQRKWYVLYTRHPFWFKTNISRSAITR